MTELDRYLGTYFLDAEHFAAACGIACDELLDLIRRKLVPEASYVVRDGTVCSFVFGAIPAPGSAAGEYFRPEMADWVVSIRRDVATYGVDGAAERARHKFIEEFAAALVVMNASVHRIGDALDEHGATIPNGLAPRLDSAWEHFLRGTFGLCVAHPASIVEIARKEALQERIAALTDNGARLRFAPGEKAELRALIDAYACASMPFSPLEYARSSRKRLVDDLRPRLGD